MNLQKTYICLLNHDLVAAERWYTRLLGRGPDNRPMPTLVQWELTNGSGLGLSSEAGIAATGAMFLYVADLAAERRRLESAGVELGPDDQGDYSTLAQVRDPGGNLLTLASPPKRPFPPA